MNPEDSPSPPKLPGLYIHIPFCRTKCPYCGFFSSTDLSARHDFLEALALEMEMYQEIFPDFDTIYIGGGTPSLLSTWELQMLFHRIHRTFRISPSAEITVEINPGSVKPDFFLELARCGVNRVVLGIQSFDPQALSFLGRTHSVEDGGLSIQWAKESGFANIGIDLIYAIPGQDVGRWLETLDQAIGFSPAHISCYELTIEPNTPLEIRYRRGEFRRPDEKALHEFFWATVEALEKAGFIQYEVSNFASEPRWICRHNQKYWEHTEYLGLGPSAHSFSRNCRWWNTDSLFEYSSKLKRNQKPVEGMESLSLEEIRLEALALAFRTKKGLEFSHFFRKYGWDLWKEKREIFLNLEKVGLIELDDGRAIPTRRGLAVADRLALI